MRAPPAHYQVTATDDVAAALAVAALRWPTDSGSPAKLLLRLIGVGHRSLLGESELRKATRLDAIQRTSGSLTGSFGEGYLDLLREEWPE
ncbi:hypothetical protein GIS00_05825 [Nakamurella sp. YIM 132087]|uniref:Uncharacterized protein n=1 Tax=Nakamurella alba TaxID=2665158 RepID=A0A7K1FJN1_9ACTN|nr:hypothetical protein [Nakamurella alba]MTD13463.1 hypothetical protein [Nakamurella alba]